MDIPGNPYEAPQTDAQNSGHVLTSVADFWRVISRSMREGVQVGAFLPGGLSFATSVLYIISSLTKAEGLGTLLLSVMIYLGVILVITILGGILGGLIGLLAGAVVWFLGLAK